MTQPESAFEARLKPQKDEVRETGLGVGGREARLGGGLVCSQPGQIRANDRRRANGVQAAHHRAAALALGWETVRPGTKWGWGPRPPSRGEGVFGQ